MNDPGLDEPIKENSKAEEDHKAEEQIEKEDEQAFLNPRSNPFHDVRSKRSTNASF